MNNSLVKRFIAGVSLRDALLVVKEFHGENILCALDLLGEHVVLPEDAERSTQGYLELIRQLSIFSPSAYVSVKLTSLGLDVSDQLARENLRRLTHEASQRGGIFIRVDMEGSDYTARTLQLVAEEHRAYPNVGTVVQSCLRRTDRDLEGLIKEKISVRLVKGAYMEPPHIAYSKKAEIESAFRKQMYLLFDKGVHPAFATHDEQILNVAKKFIQQHSIPPDRYEFEMLLGVRKDLQVQLVKDGYPVRVYVPFGSNWYPYFSRRLSDGSSNVGFIFKGLLK